MKIIMPLGTASWLIKNTGLSDKQIAEFCSITLRDVMDLRDQRIQICPVDPINDTQQLSEEEIKICTLDIHRRLCPLIDPLMNSIQNTKIKEVIYTPLKFRRSKKKATITLLKTYPMIDDKDIHQLFNLPFKKIKEYRENLEELYKNYTNEENLDMYFNVNPLWQSIKKKYNLNINN